MLAVRTRWQGHHVTVGYRRPFCFWVFLRFRAKKDRYHHSQYHQIIVCAMYITIIENVLSCQVYFLYESEAAM